MYISLFSRGPFNWLSGRRVDPEDSPGSFRNLEPRTGKLLAEVPSSGKKDVEKAVGAAKEAFKVRWNSICCLFCGKHSANGKCNEFAFRNVLESVLNIGCICLSKKDQCEFIEGSILTKYFIPWMVLGLHQYIGPFKAPFLLEAHAINPPAFFHNKQFRTCPFPPDLEVHPRP